MNDIIGSEKMRLIQNQELVELLSNWSSEVFQVQELELQYQKYRTEAIVPCITRLGVMRNVSNALWKDGYTPTEALDNLDLIPTFSSFALLTFLKAIK